MTPIDEIKLRSAGADYTIRLIERGVVVSGHAGDCTFSLDDPDLMPFLHGIIAGLRHGQWWNIDAVLRLIDAYEEMASHLQFNLPGWSGEK